MAGRGTLRHLVFFLTIVSLAGGQDDFLGVEASIVPRRLSRGEEGAVILKLSLQEGMTISPKPDFTIEFKSCPELIFPKNFYTASDLGIETKEEDGEEWLDLSDPVRIPFTVAGEAEKGSHILEGRIKYFARSQKEDWCVKTTAKFFVPFFTRSASVKKNAGIPSQPFLGDVPGDCFLDGLFQRITGAERQNLGRFSHVRMPQGLDEITVFVQTEKHRFSDQSTARL